MDLRFLELVGLTAVADMSAVAALMHGQVFFGAFFGVTFALAGSHLIRRSLERK